MKVYIQIIITLSIIITQFELLDYSILDNIKFYLKMISTCLAIIKVPCIIVPGLFSLCLKIALGAFVFGN